MISKIAVILTAMLSQKETECERTLVPLSHLDCEAAIPTGLTFLLTVMIFENGILYCDAMLKIIGFVCFNVLNTNVVFL